MIRFSNSRFAILVSSFFTSSSAYAFMVFILFSAPCFGAIGAMKRVLGGTKKVLKAVSFQIIFAWILATIVYQVGIRIENGIFKWANLIVGMIIISIVFFITNHKKTENNRCDMCPYCEKCEKREKTLKNFID